LQNATSGFTASRASPHLRRPAVIDRAFARQALAACGSHLRPQSAIIAPMTRPGMAPHTPSRNSREGPARGIARHRRHSRAHRALPVKQADLVQSSLADRARKSAGVPCANTCRDDQGARLKAIGPSAPDRIVVETAERISASACDCRASGDLRGFARHRLFGQGKHLRGIPERASVWITWARKVRTEPPYHHQSRNCADARAAR